ncbi:MAG: radical SAM protein [Erysipelotrichaceae bacterium]|nr:radical SAM protein [Erysipelotrichaceae bacterium]MDY3934391.1 radical SAM protein [Bacilli bacterium]
MKFKKVYIEICNGCNLNCDFCIKNSRQVKYIKRDEYEYIINKIAGYTKEIYLHVLGEPLMHKDINYFIDYAHNMGILVNITTNGYLINKIKDNKNIHRLNISMHSFNSRYGIEIDEYIDNVFYVVDNLRDKTFVSLRLWVKTENTKKILEYINKRYGTKILEIDNNKKIKISNNLIIDSFHEFIWPDINNSYYNENGRCNGLIDHFGILSTGEIIPCCLDSKGIINLGNIYQDNLEDVFNSKLVKEMREGFLNNKKCQELCRHCSFLGGSNESNRLEK